jgi:hypothetical protein
MSFSKLVIAENLVVNDLLSFYQTQGASMPNIERAKNLWVTEFPGKDEYFQRSCSSCHGTDISQDGKHIKTGKIIKAMSPQLNPERFTKKQKVEKWFKRNCKWTFGRECTSQEKTDFLLYLTAPINL